jgi:hypothetical protein
MAAAAAWQVIFLFIEKEQLFRYNKSVILLLPSDNNIANSA